MKRLALASALWLCACGSSEASAPADPSDETSGAEVARLRTENEALREENEALRASSEREDDSVAEETEVLAELEPLRAVCTAIVTLAGLSVRHGERHPAVLATRTALLDAQARLETVRAEGRSPDVADARSALAVMLAEERMSPAGRGEVGPRHPDAETWRARASALTALITELESHGTCTP